MIRRHASVIRLTLVTFEAISSAVLFALVSIVRFGSDEWQATWHTAGVAPLVAAASAGLAWVTTLWVAGLYRLRADPGIRNLALDVARAGLVYAAAVFAGLFLLKLPDVSRLFALWLLAAQMSVTLVTRLGLRLAFRWARNHNVNLHSVLVIGTGPTAQAFADRLERHRELGLVVIGHLRVGRGHPTDDDTASQSSIASARTDYSVSHPILGQLESIEELLHDRVVDEVIICVDDLSEAPVNEIVALCESEGKAVRIVLPGVLGLPGGRIETFDGTSILSHVYGPDRAIELMAKRILDIVAAAIGLVLLSPLAAFVGVTIVLLDGRPIMFRQVRVGLHGRQFVMLKFRSMTRDAEDRLEELACRNEIDGHAFKMTDDPRLSRVGRFLRRTSIDELPQLWNVLRGEMSLVGPRPPLPREVADYDIWHRRRLSMKPGITGLWQVSARRDQLFDRWVALDLEYIDRWSLWRDVQIIARTIPAIIQGR